MTIGIWSIGNTNPESRNAGRKLVTSEIWLAASCDLVAAEIQNPSNSTAARKSDVASTISQTEPRNGTPNHPTAITAQNAVSSRPNRKYGPSFPIVTSNGVTGVDISCSIVPRSHSRAMVSEVRKVPTSTTTPGTMKLLLSRSSLNQVLESIEIGAWISVRPWDWKYWICTLAEYPASTDSA